MEEIIYLIAIVGLGLIIFVHELGHFMAGKLMNIKVREFKFGLPGPKLFTFKIGETEYGATALPFGGYVRFAGIESELQTEEDEEDLNTPPERKYDTQPKWKKAIIMVAGPAMNMVFAIVLIAAMLMGEGAPDNSSILGKISQGSPAAKVGLQQEDKVVSIDGKAVKTWEQIVNILRKKPEERVEIVIARDGERKTFHPTLKSIKENGKERGFLGVSVHYKRMMPHTAIYEATIRTGMVSFLMVKTLYVAITQQMGLLVKDSAGPVRIVYESAKIVQESIWQYIWFLAIITINIGIVNLLPIPPLDGGRLLILAIEGIKRGELNKKAVLAVNAVGMVMLLGLMVYFVFTDIIKIMSGAPFLSGG
jgi:regulator of sigma E protease